MIRYAFTSFKLIKPRNVLIDRIHSNTFEGGGGLYLGGITGCILCLQVDGPVNIWGRGGLYISDSIRYFGRGDYVGNLGEYLSNVTKLCHYIPDFKS